LANFTLVCLVPEEEPFQVDEAPPAQGPGVRAFETVTRIYPEAFFAAAPDHDAGRLFGPGDSHYELHGTFEAADDAVEDRLVPAPARVGPTEDEAPAGAQERPPGPRQSPTGWWPARIVSVWWRFQVLVALGFAGLALVVAVLFLLTLFLGPAPVESALMASVLAVLGTAGVLLIAFSATAQSIMLRDMARSLRLLRAQAAGNEWKRSTAAGNDPGGADLEAPGLLARTESLRPADRAPLDRKAESSVTMSVHS
jgi:hypothetical protein